MPTAGWLFDPAVTLVQFSADHLPVIQPWFLHPEVRLRLGGPEWPARELTLREQPDDAEYRGLRVLRKHSWIAQDDEGLAVAYVGGEVYDRCCRYDGSNPDDPLISAVEPGPAFGFAYVVNPNRWRQGFGRATVRAMLANPDVDDVRVFAAGIDADNLASRRCATAAGFASDDDDPDWEQTVYYLFRRSPG